MAEAVVVADDELAHVELVVEDLLHEVMGREGCHLLREMEHSHIVHPREREQLQFAVERGQQARLIVLAEHLPRMSVKSDHQRLQACFAGFFHDVGYQKLMAAVYAVEEPDRGHARAQLIIQCKEIVIHNSYIRFTRFPILYSSPPPSTSTPVEPMMISHSLRLSGRVRNIRPPNVTMSH